jgi:hypothetical protein
MAGTTQKIRKLIIDAYLSGKTIVVGILTDVSTSWDVTDYDFLNDIAADRSDGANYADKEVVAPDWATAIDVANDRIEVDMIDQVWTALGLGTVGDGIHKGVFFGIKVTNDTDSPLIGVVDVRSLSEASRTPNGTDYPVRIGSEGFWHLGNA